MVIENIMYFALGFLAAGLLALMIMPSIWHRAVRLTKKRIEAATPMTMAEFRADKDQLRAEFALSTRRLEQNVEQLRARLAEQLSDMNSKKSNLSHLKVERDQQLSMVRELEEREADLRRRILDLEKEGAELAQRLRTRDRQLADKVTELEIIHEGRRNTVSTGANLMGRQLSGDYSRDIEDLLSVLAGERERANAFEEQVRRLIAQLESADRQSSAAREAVATLREQAATNEDAATSKGSALVEAEARIASAENRLNQLLEETQEIVENGDARTSQLLAEKLSLEEQLENLREKVVGVETAVINDWDAERLEQSHMRERLNDIASEVSRLVYAVDGDTVEAAEESLFDRVQRFAGTAPVDDKPSAPVNGGAKPARPARIVSGKLSARMAALRDMRTR
ncbi:MAG TPA: hypothetical protein VIL84_05060 [Devosiaceae bacterium]